jgi:hypothetical protein
VLLYGSHDDKPARLSAEQITDTCLDSLNSWLPSDLDYPEILGFNVPNAAMVTDNQEDELITVADMESGRTRFRVRLTKKQA